MLLLCFFFLEVHHVSCNKSSQGQHRFSIRHIHKHYLGHQEIQSVRKKKKLFWTLTVTLQEYNIIMTRILIFDNENFDLQIDLLHPVAIWSKLRCVNYSYFRSATTRAVTEDTTDGQWCAVLDTAQTHNLNFKKNPTKSPFKTGWQNLH